MRHFGWYARRRGILEHLETGTISLLDAAIHDFLCLIADHRNGVAWASAEKIRALCPLGISLKQVQRSLAKLERLGWVKRFLIEGRRGNYPIVIGKYFVRDVSLTWKSVNLERTTDWRDVQFDPVTDPSFIADGGVTETGTEASPSQELRIENGENKNGSEGEGEVESELAGETKNADEQSNHLDSAFDGWDCPPERKLELSASLYQSLYIDKERMTDARCAQFLRNAESSWANSWGDIARGKFTLLEWLSGVIEHGRTSRMLYPGVFKKRLHQLERGELTVRVKGEATGGA